MVEGVLERLGSFSLMDPRREPWDSLLSLLVSLGENPFGVLKHLFIYNLRWLLVYISIFIHLKSRCIIDIHCLH